MSKKEHHFCFAHRGERMQETLFDRLPFQYAQGIRTDDGIQLVSISLQRNKGRRESNISNLISEYNALLPSINKAVVPICFAPLGKPIVCFNAQNKSNPIMDLITRRVNHQRTLYPMFNTNATLQANSTYWRWEAGGEAPPKKRKTSSTMNGFESLVRELNLNPRTINMQSAYESIITKCATKHGLTLDSRSHTQHRDILLKEMRIMFEKELAYIVSPPIGVLDAKATALTGETDLMHDLGLSEASSLPDPKINDTVKTALANMLPNWERRAWVQMTFAELLTEFNRTSEGIYRRSSVIPFTKPLVDARIATIDDETIRFDVQGVERLLRKMK